MDTELKVKIGDWVVLHSGKTVEITSDDMWDVKYEDIARVLVQEECPLLKLDYHAIFHFDGMFLDLLKMQCPHAYKLFIDWLKQYKEHTNWSLLFGKCPFIILPFEMQVGMLFEFVSTINPNKHFPHGSWTDKQSTLNCVLRDFARMEVACRNKNTKGNIPKTGS